MLRYFISCDNLNRAFIRNEVDDMSRRCPVTGKGPISGNARSHSLRATRRRWNVNLQKYTFVDENGQRFSVRMSARAARALKKGK